MFHIPAHKNLAAPAGQYIAPVMRDDSPLFDVEGIMAFEDGTLSDEDLVGFVQDGINSGLIWKLQGSYGRLAMQMIRDGACVPAEPCPYHARDCA